MSEKFANCPFCGAEASAYKMVPAFDHSWHIECDHDDECILISAHGMIACEPTEKRIAAAWNRRHQEQDNSSTFERCMK